MNSICVLMMKGGLLMFLSLIGSLIDFETGNFKKHSSDKWNRQVDILAEEGHISKKQAQVEKIIPQETTESSPTF